MVGGWAGEVADRVGSRARAALAGLAAAAAFLGVWSLTLDASLVYDEVVYLDVARNAFQSAYYPGEVFLRHPPLGLALLSGWETLGLLSRAWPLPWVLGGLGLLAGAVHASEGSTWWLTAPILLSPVLVPLTTVTLYPPMFFFLALAAWGWATRREWIELVAWNLAVFTHELALLLLAVVLLPVAVKRVRRGRWDLGGWARLVLPYPAALAWGGFMVVSLVQGGDARGGWVLATLADPSPSLLAVLKLKALVGAVLAVAFLPLVRRPDRDAHAPSRGVTYAAVVAVLTAPFYRYAVAVVPLLVTLRAADPPGWFQRHGPWPMLVAFLAASGVAVGAAVTGYDTLNAATPPGLVDHEAGADLVEDGGEVVVRSPVSLAHVLQERGWQLEATAATGPAWVELSDGDTTLRLHRAETLARIQELDRVDHAVLPSTWRTVPDGLPGDGWAETGRADRLVRWTPPTPTPGAG